MLVPCSLAVSPPKKISFYGCPFARDSLCESLSLNVFELGIVDALNETVDGKLSCVHYVPLG